MTEPDTEDMKAARRIAEEKGYRIVMFRGDNLHMKDSRGRSVNARAMVVGRTVYVRADHARFTASQLVRHELAHPLIDSGEIDVEAVRERLAKTYTLPELERWAQAYIEATSGGDLTADEAWVEMICDSYADMNIFAGEKVRGEIYAGFLSDVNAAAEAERNTTRGPPTQNAATEEAQSAVENAAADEMAETIVSKNGYTLTDNAEYGTIEVQFSEKPGEEVRDALKKLKFRWNGKRKVWYGNATREEITEALDKAYAAGNKTAGEAELLAYKSSESYKINAKLRGEGTLTDADREFVKNLDEFLETLPTYNGTVYRDVMFDDMGDEEAYNAFLEDHSAGNVVSYPAYTSTSTTRSGYPLEGKYVVKLEIVGKSGRNVDGYGDNMEQEILFPRDTAFRVERIENINGVPTVYMQEVDYGQESGNGSVYQRDSSGEQGPSAEIGTGEMQQMQKALAGSEVQRVPDSDTERNLADEERVPEVQPEVRKAQSEAPAKKRSRPRTVESTEKLEDFGEKIGGARKDWRTDGLNIDDLSDMNDRERMANVKKDNVWKRPDYKKLIEGGADRGILFGVNEIRKSLPASISYGYKWSEDVVREKQNEYVSTVRAIQEIAGQAKEKDDFAGC